MGRPILRVVCANAMLRREKKSTCGEMGRPESLQGVCGAGLTPPWLEYRICRVWARRPRVADADGPAAAQIGQIRVYLARVFSFETIKSFTRSV
jgi:hypothetical protein